MNNFTVLAKDFVANESAVIDLRSSGVEDKLNALIFQNQKGQSAQFLWQSDKMERGGYFKEVMNNLGVKVAHYDGFLTVTNGGGSQFLEAEVKI